MISIKPHTKPNINPPGRDTEYISINGMSERGSKKKSIPTKRTVTMNILTKDQYITDINISFTYERINLIQIQKCYNNIIIQLTFCLTANDLNMASSLASALALRGYWPYFVLC